MSTINDGVGAFPMPGVYDASREQINPVNCYYDAGGMTLRQYAAISLRVPDSGDAWLDEMITKAVRTEIAAKAAQGELAATATSSCRPDPNDVARFAYQVADAMLAARQGGAA